MTSRSRERMGWTAATLLAALSAAALFSGPANPQTQRSQPGGSTTFPLAVTSTVATGTITSGGTFQTALAAPAAGAVPRRGCLLQNRGANTMYVNVGILGSATQNLSFTLTAGQTFSCVAGGIVIQDAINVDGTTADRWTVVSQ